MKKTILRTALYSVATVVLIAVGCGDNGVQDKSSKVGDFINMFANGGNDGGTRHILTVNVTPGEGGRVSRSPNSTSYKTGDQVTVTAEPFDNYIFVGWSGALNDTTTILTVTMSKDLALIAHFIRKDAPTYTLSVNSEPSGGGEVSREPNRTVYSAGETVVVTATPADGYKFTEWSGGAGGTDTSVTVTMNGDMTLKANFQQQTYTLSVGANTAQGGTVSRNPSKAVYTYGEQVTVTATPEKGYIFKGWTDDAAPANSSVIITTDGNKTLTAIFELQTYKLTTNVDPSGREDPLGGPTIYSFGYVTRDPNKETYVYGERVTVTATPYDRMLLKLKTIETQNVIATPSHVYERPPSQFVFTGWTGALESTSNVVTITMDDNKTLTAHFKERTELSYTLATITNQDVGATISRSPDNASYKEGQTVTVTAPTVTGYTFTGWSGDATGTANPLTFIMNKDMTLIANYIQNDYTLTVEIYPANGGSVSRNPNNDAYTYNQTVTLTATPASGYKFIEWSGAATGTNANTTVTMNSNKSLIAKFEQATYTLETAVSPSGGGSVSRNPNKDVYNYNEQVTVTATAADCYFFKGWSGATTGITNSITITMNSNKTLTASFPQLGPYTLTTNVSPSGGGTVSRSPNQTSYACGTTATVTATAASGYVFTGWSGDASGTTNPMAITMDGNKMLTANFQQPLYMVIVSSVGIGASNNGSYVAGATVTINAGTAPSGYKFKNWTTESSHVTFVNANNAMTTFTMPTNAVTVTAVFIMIKATFTDSRNGQTYEMVKIGNQTWMAENLNYQTGNSWCYVNSIDSCNKYGRLYDWNTTMAGSQNSSINTNKIQGICPVGWHFPSSEEWDDLVMTIGGFSVAGKKLKSVNVWKDPATDEFGFSALPGGLYNNLGHFVQAGDGGTWWTATEAVATEIGVEGGSHAYTRQISHGDYVGMGYMKKSSGCSVRCVQDVVR